MPRSGSLDFDDLLTEVSLHLYFSGGIDRELHHFRHMALFVHDGVVGALDPDDAAFLGDAAEAGRPECARPKSIPKRGVFRQISLARRHAA